MRGQYGLEGEVTDKEMRIDGGKVWEDLLRVEGVGEVNVKGQGGVG